MAKIVKQSFPQEFETKKVIIFVSYLNVVVRKFSVCLDDPISVLFHFLPIGQKTIFYQGNIIQSYKTFKNYGITDNDRIVILPTQGMTLTTEQFWRKVTKRDIDNKPEIEAVQNPLMMNSIACRQDLLMFRIENHEQCYRRLIQNFRFLSNESKGTENATNLNWEETEHPNKNPLPMIW
jgi:hypothetical protein